MKNWNGAHHTNSHRTDGEFCVRCGRALGDEFIMLEMSNRGGGYKDPSVSFWPESESQGLFAFGKDCAKRTLEEQKARKP